MAKDPRLSNYLPIARGRIAGFIIFLRELTQCEMQTTSFRIRTRIAESTFNNDNRYATRTSVVTYLLQNLEEY